jgi:hypothetical protein
MSETTDAYELLGLRRGLQFPADEIAAAFREAGKVAHPDAGGSEGSFARLQEAAAVLTSPSRRLRLWMELEGLPVEARGEISPALMDVFGEVGAVMQPTQVLIRKREEARSALGLALLEAETLAAQAELEAAIARLEELIAAECATFADLEANRDAERASRVLRNLGFLEKWKAGLRSSYARLV